MLMVKSRIFYKFYCINIWVKILKKPKGTKKMKIRKLNEQTKMKFKKEGYDDEIENLRALLGIDAPTDANPVFLIDMGGEYCIELTLAQIEDIMKAKGYDVPKLMGAPQVGIMREERGQ